MYIGRVAVSDDFEDCGPTRALVELSDDPSEDIPKHVLSELIGVVFTSDLSSSLASYKAVDLCLHLFGDLDDRVESSLRKIMGTWFWLLTDREYLAGRLFLDYQQEFSPEISHEELYGTYQSLLLKNDGEE